MPKEECGISIATATVGQDPPLTVFRVRLFGKESEWREAFGSREALEWFLRGVRAGASMPELYAASYELPR